MPKCSKTENENNIDCKVDLKIYPKDDFRKSLDTIKKCLTLVITRVGESNLYSFEGINGRGTPCKLSGFQEGAKGYHPDLTYAITRLKPMVVVPAGVKASVRIDDIKLTKIYN